jgi:hypothetical protein
MSVGLTLVGDIGDKIGGREGELDYILGGMRLVVAIDRIGVAGRPPNFEGIIVDEH